VFLGYICRLKYGKVGVLIFFFISYILLSVSLYFLFPKAGVSGVKGLIPGVNFVEWCKIIGRKPSHALWLLFPIVNIFTYAGMCVDMMYSFGKTSFLDSALAVIYAPIAFFKLAFDEKEKYKVAAFQDELDYKNKIVEAEKSGDSYALKKLVKNNPYQKTVGREWGEAIIFAVFAAAFIRMFLIEAYKIPTGSMEGSLLIGDFLFVSKAHYGIRTPETIAMIPLLHNRIPIIDKESYFDKPTLPEFRLPALENIDHNKPIVFNYPEGDSVYVIPGRTYSIHDARRKPQLANLIKSKRIKLDTRPVDKRDHYIKRCIGMPGDSLQIKDAQVYINGQAAENPTNLQFNYVLYPNGVKINMEKLVEWGISPNYDIREQEALFILTLSNAELEKVKSLDPKIKITRMQNRAGDSFPHSAISREWTVDDFGPIYIPQKGATTKLTPENIAFYRRIIEVYEENTFQQKGNTFIINGEQTDSYTFQQDYYWGMGDNRHSSEDSRYWGYVPHDHIVGKPLFIWFSTKDGDFRNGINWSRIFTGATKM